MRRRHLLALAVGVGVALLTNPLWAFPDATADHHQYRATPAVPADVHAADAVLVCSPDSDAATCRLERRAVTDGVAVGRDPAAFDDRPQFVYFADAGRYYRTSVAWVDGARTATGVLVSYETVRAAVAVDGVDDLTPASTRRVVETALASGTADARERVVLDESRPDGPLVVRSGGRYLAVEYTGQRRPLPLVDRFGRPLRAVASLTGAALVLVAGRFLLSSRY